MIREGSQDERGKWIVATEERKQDRLNESEASIELQMCLFSRE